ncbi:MAG: hypothetical protein ABIJ33_02015 [Patescibacteria group bacterium]
MLKQLTQTFSHPINQMFNLGERAVAWKKVGKLQAGGKDGDEQKIRLTADSRGSTQVESNLAYHLRGSIHQKEKVVNNKIKGVEVAGFAPAEPWMISQVLYSSTPTPGSLYNTNNTQIQPSTFVK